MDLVLDRTFFFSSFGKLAPCGAKKHRVMKAGPKVTRERRGKEGKERKGVGEDSERKGYYTFFIKFPGTKPHQSLSEIEGRERERGRMF